MLKKILLGLLALIVVFVIVVVTRPETYRVERSITIAAPSEVVFAQINDFHAWDGWSPWNKLDPNQKKTYDGPPAGLGAKTAWSGNDQVGEGRMTLTDSKPNERVDIKLEFIKPFPSTSEVDFVMKPEGKDTKLTWGMIGHNDFMGKAFCLFVDMDAMLGKDFSEGLAGIKRLSEEEAKKREEAAAKAAAEAAAAAAAAAQPADSAAPVAEAAAK